MKPENGHGYMLFFYIFLARHSYEARRYGASRGLVAALGQLYGRRRYLGLQSGCVHNPLLCGHPLSGINHRCHDRG